MTLPVANDSDAPAGEWSNPLPIETVRRLSALNSWKSFGHILLDWVQMIAAAVVCWQVLQWNLYAGIPVYLLTIIFIGSRQHALSILMHEGSHYRLMKNRLANDFFAELFTAWPMNISMRNYREHHFPHHRSPNTDADPDWRLRSQDESWEFPKTVRGLVTMFLFDFCGLRFVDQYRSFGRYAFPEKRKRDWIDLVRQVFNVTLVVSLTYFGLWIPYLLLWIVPTLSWLKVALRMRTIAEHYALDYSHMYRQTRTTYANGIERILIAPHNIGYHLDHHLYPSVPFYNLRALHEELMKTDEFRNQAHITKGYVQVLRECLSVQSQAPEVESPRAAA
jgi:fatty acid desaturase